MTLLSHALAEDEDPMPEPDPIDRLAELAAHFRRLARSGRSACRADVILPGDRAEVLEWAVAEIRGLRLLAAGLAPDTGVPDR